MQSFRKGLNGREKAMMNRSKRGFFFRNLGSSHAEISWVFGGQTGTKMDKVSSLSRTLLMLQVGKLQEPAKM